MQDAQSRLRSNAATVERISPAPDERNGRRQPAASNTARPDTRLALIIDDDIHHNRALERTLGGHGFDVSIAASVEAAADRLGGDAPRVAFVALDVDGEDGVAMLDHPGLAECEEILLMHEHDTPRRIREGMSKGAGYFLAKPFDGEFLAGVLHDLTQGRTSIRGVPPVNGGPAPLDQFGDLRGSSAAMRGLFRVLRKVATVDTAVLLTGESGTGKDLAACTLHRFSSRADGPFIATNCAAIPPDLCESELFGHERGSFSGATRCHRGLFEQADGGTLFLDEITEMPMEHQVKLLRVLESGRFRRVGGETDIAVDVRIITASNRDPEEAIRDGALRQDLYYRIARFPIDMPALRERDDDVEGLARHFLDRLNEREGSAKTFSSDALASLASYSFPGNVRELQSLVERAFLLSPGIIRSRHLPPLTAEAARAGNYIRVRVGASVYEAEKALLLATLQKENNDKTATAEILGISLRTLYNRLNAYAEEDNRAS
jgi:DNA-binding NtrC family response regulator